LYVNDFDQSANGFRLPTSLEWELAARYRGCDSTIIGYLFHLKNF
jgi:hypothetical protein